MAGLVLGEIDGIAPGLELDLFVDPVEFYTEGEFMMDMGEGASSFFYFWSELTVWPAEWLQAGLVSQRTRVLQTEFDLQRGFLVWRLARRLRADVLYVQSGRRTLLRLHAQCGVLIAG